MRRREDETSPIVSSLGRRPAGSTGTGRGRGEDHPGLDVRGRRPGGLVEPAHPDESLPGAYRPGDEGLLGAGVSLPVEPVGRRSQSIRPLPSPVYGMRRKIGSARGDLPGAGGRVLVCEVPIGEEERGWNDPKALRSFSS